MPKASSSAPVPLDFSARPWQASGSSPHPRLQRRHGSASAARPRCLLLPGRGAAAVASSRLGHLLRDTSSVLTSPGRARRLSSPPSLCCCSTSLHPCKSRRLALFSAPPHDRRTGRCPSPSFVSNNLRLRAHGCRRLVLTPLHIQASCLQASSVYLPIPRPSIKWRRDLPHPHHHHSTKVSPFTASSAVSASPAIPAANATRSTSGPFGPLPELALAPSPSSPT